jgi:hypothetical protein
MNLKALVSATAVLATLTVAGCGSAVDISAGRSGAVVLTKDNFASTMSTASSRAGSVHISGVFRVQGQALTLRADESMGGTSFKDAQATMTMTLPGKGSVELRLVGGVLYIHGPQLGLSQQAGKPWVKVDLTDPTNPLGQMFSKITDNMDPSKLADAFKSITKLSRVGPENIDGLQSTHYRVSVDTSRLGSLLGLPAGGPSAALPKTLTYNVWVDADNRPVQLSMINPHFTIQLQFSRWGEQVHVVAPPASQVSEISI